LPEQVTGEWYITPWSDTYDIVLEDTFDLNINPDDPNELDNNNYKAYPLKILLTSPPDLVVTNVTPTAQGQGGEPFQVTWTVQNQGNREIVNQSWVDTIYLSDRPSLDDPNAKKWLLGKVKQISRLGAGQSETFTLDTILSPAAAGQYIIVETNSEPPTLWEGPYTYNNEGLATTNVTRMPADLIVSSIIAPASSFSGEPIDLSWTVTNVGASMWSGTKYWYDEVWVSPDPTLIQERATKVGSFIYSPQQPLATGDNYTQTSQITLPRGIEGNYYIYVRTNFQGNLAATAGDNQKSREDFIERGFEDPANNISRTILPVVYHEPDLQVGNLVVPVTAPLSGQNIPVSWTVTNTGTRATRENRWSDRIYLSRDSSLDMSDLLLGEFERQGVLGLDEFYEGHLNVILPQGISGNFSLLVFSDANLVDVNDSRVDKWSIPAGAKIYFETISKTLARVPEFFDEGNNVTAAFLPIILREPPDLRVTSLLVPERATIGQSFNLTYTVSNSGTGDTPVSQSNWTDLIYLSRDQFFDPLSDIYLDSINHSNGLIKDNSYTITKTLSIPTYLKGPFYAFVVTDYGQLSGGKVFEGSLENNNATSSTQPIIFEFAPPSDLQVDGILAPVTAHSGDTVAIQWTVTNRGENAASGQWSDAVYLSLDTVWDINDPLVGRLSFNGILEGEQSYTQILETFLPPALPGQYRLIVRPDIYNQIEEATNEANNFTTSANPLNVMVEELPLGVPLPTHLNAGQSRLYQVKLNAEQTFKVSLDSEGSETKNELFLRYNNLPTGTAYDATNTEELGPDPSMVISATDTGVYYILVQNVFGSSPATIKAELLSFGITDVMTDRGGDSRYVTTNIKGAQFQPGALVKLVRPGIAEYLPVRYQVINSTKITAIFDLTEAPHGLYDVKVINPNGNEAIVPYRYLVERTIEPDVTLGLGGSRVLAPGETGTYGIAVKSLTNIDTPYVHFQFGIPSLGDNNFLLSKFDEAVKQMVGISELPYVQLTSNLRGQPPQGAIDLPWASLISDLNTDGEILAPGYIFDLPTAEAIGRTFNVLTYPQLQELLKLQPDALNDLLPGEESKIA
ncbi:hypothetical protein C7H19_24935, partial [Aphanothece hegewaldii CCALA 016]